MKSSHNRRILTGAIAVMLAALSPVPSTFAQAPAPPPTSTDGKTFQNIEQLASENKWVDVMKAAENFFKVKGNDLSPFAKGIRYYLGLAYLQQPRMQDDAVREFKVILADPKADPGVKEQVQLLVAKAYTLKGISFPADNEQQRKTRDDVFNDAVKGYDAYIAAYPNSRSNDTAYYLSGVLCQEMKRYDDAIKRFSSVETRYPKSPLRNDAVLNQGKTYLLQAGDKMTAPPGKEPTPESIKEALAIYEGSALKFLARAYIESNDLAIQNETQFYIGQIRLIQSQHPQAAEEEARKSEQDRNLQGGLDAFRAVRSIEEVLATQTAKIKALSDAIDRLPKGTPEYMGNRQWIENLIGVESEKMDRLKTGTDQYLTARVAVARIFLFQKKLDECRTIIRYLQGQKELFAKDKESLAAITALLCHTYVGQDNVEKSLEAYNAFRGEFKGNSAGEDLPLFVANLLVEKGKAAQAEEIVNQGMADYNPWQFGTDAIRVLIRVALDKLDFQKALALCEKVLGNAPKPEVEVETLMIKGSIQEQMAIAQSQPAMQQTAFQTFQLVRDKFPNHAKAEDAWYRQTQILAGLAGEGEKAIQELKKYIAAFSGSGGKSESTKVNLGNCQYTLGKVLKQVNRLDEAVAAFTKTITTYPEAEVVSDSYFQIFNIERDRKNYSAALRQMEEYVQKFPKHKNVFFAQNFIAEMMFSAQHRVKKGETVVPPVTIADLEAGTKKLIEYVDYELANPPAPGAKEVPSIHGEGALVKIADKWSRQIPPGNFALLPNEQKLDWQKCVDRVLSAVDKLLKSYPEGERWGDGLEYAVTVQVLRVKAQVIDTAKGEAYFRDLVAKYGKTNETKSRILVALASFIGDKDPKAAAAVRKEAAGLVPDLVQKTAPGSTEKYVVPSFQPGDWDKLLADSFEEKRYDEMGKNITRVRQEYPIAANGTPSKDVADAQAVCLFWEGKILEEQGKIADAGKKFQELSDKYPNTTKKLEADYGVINGQFVSGTLKTDAARQSAIDRLSTVAKTTSKGFELQAKALYLLAQIYEDMQDYDNAATNFEKVAVRFASVPKLAGDGLWKAANIWERQANKEIPVRLPAEKIAQAARMKKAKEDAEKAEEAKKPKAAEPAKDGKPGTPAPAAKPGEAKPADKTTAAK